MHARKTINSRSDFMNINTLSLLTTHAKRKIENQSHILTHKILGKHPWKNPERKINILEILLIQPIEKKYGKFITTINEPVLA
jgi:hypothetical protein